MLGRMGISKENYEANKDKNVYWNLNFQLCGETWRGLQAHSCLQSWSQVMQVAFYLYTVWDWE